MFDLGVRPEHSSAFHKVLVYCSVCATALCLWASQQTRWLTTREVKRCGKCQCGPGAAQDVTWGAGVSVPRFEARMRGHHYKRTRSVRGYSQVPMMT